MSKKKKIIIAILIILVLILGVLLAIYLSGTHSEGAKVYKEQVTKQVQEITDSQLSQVEKATKEAQEAVLQTAGQGAEGSPGDGGQGGTGSENGGGSNGGSGTGTGEMTQETKDALKAELEKKYYGILETQKQEAIGILNSLIDQAKADYKSLVAAGKKNPASLGTLASDYMSRANAMEAQMDQSFEQIVASMEEQLANLGIEGEGMLADFKAEYEQIKEANRSAFMDKAMSAVKGS